MTTLCDIQPFDRRRKIAEPAAYDAATVVGRLVHVVASQFDVPPAAVSGRSRINSHSEARQVVFYLLRARHGWTLKAIGEAFDRDHATVIHGIRKITRGYAVDADLRRRVDLTEAELSTSDATESDAGSKESLAA